MEGDKNEGVTKGSEKIPLEPTKSVFSYGDPESPAPMRFKCDKCGEIIGWDILWKTEGNVKKPFCEKCKNPVVPL